MWTGSPSTGPSTARSRCDGFTRRPHSALRNPGKRDVEVRVVDLDPVPVPGALPGPQGGAGHLHCVRRDIRLVHSAAFDTTVADKTLEHPVELEGPVQLILVPRTQCMVDRGFVAVQIEHIWVTLDDDPPAARTQQERSSAADLDFLGHPVRRSLGRDHAITAPAPRQARTRRNREIVGRLASRRQDQALGEPDRHRCGAKGTRTPNPLLAKQVRYQLRHGPAARHPPRQVPRPGKAGQDVTRRCR